MSLFKALQAALLSFVIVASPARALAGDAFIFQGANMVRSLADNLNIGNKAYILTGTTDPTVAARSAPRGSLYLRYGASGGALFTKADDGLTTNWVPSAPNVATVLGPGGAADNALARFDGATGYLIQSSSASLSDAGVLTVPNAILSGLTANTVPYLDGSKQLTSSAVTPTVLSYVDFTSSGQTQLDGKQPLDATLTAWAAFNSNGILAQTAADTFAARTITGTANQITVTNGNGVSGNPTLALPQDIATGSSPTFATVTANLTGNVTGAVTGNASTATALAANPADCAADTYATTIAASGALTCATVTNAGLAGSIAMNKLAAQTVQRAAYFDASGFLTPSSTTGTELGYVNGVTSAIQTQINTKAPTASPTFSGTITFPGSTVITSGGLIGQGGTPAYGSVQSNGTSSDGSFAVVSNGADAWAFRKVRSDGSSGMGIKDASGFGVPAFQVGGAEGFRIASTSQSYLAGSTTQNIPVSYGPGERTERASVQCGAASAILGQSGSWISSVANRSTSKCSLTIAASVFSSAAQIACVAMTFQGSQASVWQAINPSSTTNIDVWNSAAADFSFHILCQGAK